MSDAPNGARPTEGAGGAGDALAELSPVRSMAAISFSFLLFTQVLSRVGAATLATLLPSAFPAQPDEATLVVPSTLGLVAMLVMSALNATLSGLVAGRVGRAFPLLHGIILGTILGMFGALSMGGLHDFPGWFALAFFLTPSLGASLGGYLASRVGGTRARRLVAEAVASKRPPSGDA